MYEELFTHQEEIFKVIANQKRLELIQLLTHGEMHVNEIVSMLGISQSNVSQHLSLLRQADIVSTRKDGTTVYYRLRDKRIAQACNLIRRFLIDNDKLPETAAVESDPDTLYPLVRDPVCGMRMSVVEVSAQTEHEKKPYFFCATGCKDKFMQNPSSYIENKAKKEGATQ